MEFRIVRHTHRFDDACNFWGELLGFPVAKEWPAGDGQGRGRIFGYGDVGRIELIEQDTPARTVEGVFVALEVKSAEVAHDALAAAGIAVTTPLAVQPWGHRNFGVTDPSGLDVTFFEIL
ncbi:MAG: hypothetical protein RJA49_83 [Actinomycetota bacterium]|jgi:uncharacterized glyoxalase superfamily protein PhnB